jgi:hypothetical protein
LVVDLCNFKKRGVLALSYWIKGAQKYVTYWWTVGITHSCGSEFMCIEGKTVKQACRMKLPWNKKRQGIK